MTSSKIPEALPWRGVFSTIQIIIIFVSFLGVFFLWSEKPEDVVELMVLLFGILIVSLIGVILVIVAVNIPILLVRWTITATVDFAKNTVDFAKNIEAK